MSEIKQKPPMLTLEDILKLFKEADERLDKRFKETSKELDKRIKETDERFKKMFEGFEETKQIVEKTSKTVSSLGNTWG